MRKVVLLALLAISLIIASQSATAACLRIYVYDNTNKPVNGAAISVDGFPRGVANNGNAEIWYIGSGNHRIEARYLRGATVYYGASNVWVGNGNGCFSGSIYAQMWR